MPSVARLGQIPSRVRIVEVGPRDGLQNEKGIVAAADKVALIRALVAAGLTTIEAGSFVSPKWVPQMATSADVLRQLKRPGKVSFPVLVPNLIGLKAAIAAGADTIAIFASATKGFARANLNASLADSLKRFTAVAEAAWVRDLKIRGYVSCAMHCPYDGWVPPSQTAERAAQLVALGCYEVSLCDTTGAGTPARARAMALAAADAISIERVAVHFHDTYGQALANTLACLEIGVATVDSSVAGLGGCPYSPGAAGNLATEDLVYMLDGMGIETGVDLEKLVRAGQSICATLGKAPMSRVAAVLSTAGAACVPAQIPSPIRKSAQ